MLMHFKKNLFVIMHFDFCYYSILTHCVFIECLTFINRMNHCFLFI